MEPRCSFESRRGIAGGGDLARSHPKMNSPTPSIVCKIACDGYQRERRLCLRPATNRREEADDVGSLGAYQCIDTATAATIITKSSFSSCIAAVLPNFSTRVAGTLEGAFRHILRSPQRPPLLGCEASDGPAV